MINMIIVTIIAATLGIVTTASAQWGNNPWGKTSGQELNQKSRSLQGTAAPQVVSLTEGQRLTLRDGGYLTLKSGQLTLVNLTGVAKVFPAGSKLTKDSSGVVQIWGTGGTTIVGTGNVESTTPVTTKSRGGGPN